MSRAIQFIERWLAKSGETTFRSWIITVLYLVDIVLCFILRNKMTDDKPRQILWSSVTVSVRFMGINKQLDFQTLIIMSGRYITWKTGIWEDARLIQRSLALSVLFPALIAVIFVLV